MRWMVILMVLWGPVLAAERAFVDVNRASAQELATVPGMGPKLARALVESREREGPFAHAAELLRVKGMGPVKGPRIARYLLFPTKLEEDAWTATAERPQHRLDVNLAQPDELAPLPGMGLPLAYRIVADRTRNGAYRTLEDLYNVAGVTRQRVRAWSAYLYVAGPP